MGITAENLAEKYNISREECDAFAIRSQQTWKKGQWSDTIIRLARDINTCSFVH